MAARIHTAESSSCELNAPQIAQASRAAGDQPCGGGGPGSLSCCYFKKMAATGGAPPKSRTHLGGRGLPARFEAAAEGGRVDGSAKEVRGLEWPAGAEPSPCRCHCQSAGTPFPVLSKRLPSVRGFQQIAEARPRLVEPDKRPDPEKQQPTARPLAARHTRPRPPSVTPAPAHVAGRVIGIDVDAAVAGRRHAAPPLLAAAPSDASSGEHRRPRMYARAPRKARRCGSRPTR